MVDREGTRVNRLYRARHHRPQARQNQVHTKRGMGRSTRDICLHRRGGGDQTRADIYLKWPPRAPSLIATNIQINSKKTRPTRKHWRGTQAIFAPNGTPVLALMIFSNTVGLLYRLAAARAKHHRLKCFQQKYAEQAGSSTHRKIIPV